MTTPQYEMLIEDECTEIRLVMVRVYQSWLCCMRDNGDVTSQTRARGPAFLWRVDYARGMPYVFPRDHERVWADWHSANPGVDLAKRWDGLTYFAMAVELARIGTAAPPARVNITATREALIPLWRNLLQKYK